MPEPELVVVVTGLPGAGKTTVATELGERLHMPVVSRDSLREALYDHLHPLRVPYEAIGDVAYEAFLLLAVRLPSCVIESAFYRSRHTERILALARPMVQVFCRCPVDVAQKRFNDRGSARVGVAFANQDWDLWREEMGEPLPLRVPCVEVDTTSYVDSARLALSVRAAAAQSRS